MKMQKWRKRKRRQRRRRKLAISWSREMREWEWYIKSKLMGKRDRFSLSLENDENFSSPFYTPIDRIQLNTFDIVVWLLQSKMNSNDDNNSNKKESIFCRKTIINFRFDLFFRSFIFPFSLTFTTSSSFLDGTHKKTRRTVKSLIVS